MVLQQYVQATTIELLITPKGLPGGFPITSTAYAKDWWLRKLKTVLPSPCWTQYWKSIWQQQVEWRKHLDENKDKQKQYCLVFDMVTRRAHGQQLPIYERLGRKWSGSLRNFLRAMAASCCAVECVRVSWRNPVRDFIRARRESEGKVVEYTIHQLRKKEDDIKRLCPKKQERLAVVSHPTSNI
jgi:hypothetical protein